MTGRKNWSERNEDGVPEPVTILKPNSNYGERERMV